VLEQHLDQRLLFEELIKPLIQVCKAWFYYVLDSSGSIGAQEFERAKSALIDMASALNIQPKKVHITVINYSGTVTVPIVFRDVLVNGFTIQLLIQKIRAIPYLNSATATGDALREARNICGHSCRPFGEGAARSVVVFTDGHSNAGVSVKPEADALVHTTKANVFAVGIGSGINKAELDIIASKPQYVYQVANYSELLHAINNITIFTCDMPVFVMPNVKVESEVPANTYRYYQIDTTSFMRNSNGAGAFVSINTAIHKGRTRVFTSTTNTNPQASSSRESQGRSLRNGFEQSYLEYVPPGSSTFYFSIFGVDQENEYDFITNLFDVNGNTIG